MNVPLEFDEPSPHVSAGAKVSGGYNQHGELLGFIAGQSPVEWLMKRAR